MEVWELRFNTYFRMLPRNVQTLLFSATFPDKVMGFAQKFAPNANEIKLQKNELTVKGISQMYMDCPTESAKYDILVKLYGLMTVGSSVIFVKVDDPQTLCPVIGC
jgi:ATP-dependent RNA helicase DDX19/DBP5